MHSLNHSKGIIQGTLYKVDFLYMFVVGADVHLLCTTFSEIWLCPRLQWLESHCTERYSYFKWQLASNGESFKQLSCMLDYRDQISKQGLSLKCTPDRRHCLISHWSITPIMLVQMDGKVYCYGALSFSNIWVAILIRPDLPDVGILGLRFLVKNV